MVKTILSLGADAISDAGLHGTALISATDSDHCHHNILEALLKSEVDVNAKVKLRVILPAVRYLPPLNVQILKLLKYF